MLVGAGRRPRRKGSVWSTPCNTCGTRCQVSIRLHGLSKDTVARMFVAPSKGTYAATNYVGAVDARVANKRNNASTCDHNTHWARVQVKLLMEFQAFHQQLNCSGDDMNVIQVGRPAVSRYHNTRKFYMTDEGVDYEVHDWPTAASWVSSWGALCFSMIWTTQTRSYSARMTS